MALEPALCVALLLAAWNPMPARAAEPDPTADAIPGRAALLADAPLLDRPALEDPVNTEVADGLPGARRLLAHPLLFPLSVDADRLTISLRARHISGRIWSWPADHPWLLLDRTPDGGLTLTAGPDTLRMAPVDSRPDAGWQTIAAALDGPTGRITVLIDGRPAAHLDRAPFSLPPGDDLSVGPAVGDAANLAAWPDRLTDDRLLDHHLSAIGRRPPPIAARVELIVRSGRGRVRLGCPRFAPDGGWLAGCHSGALVLLDRATGLPTGWFLEHLDPITGVDIDPTGRFVATADGSHTVLVWRVSTRQVDTRIDLSHPITSLRFSPDGRWLAGWTGPGVSGAPGLAFVPFHSPAARPRVAELPAPTRTGAWDSSGQTLALGFDAHPPHRARPDGSLTALATPPTTALAWHPTQPVLFVGAADGAIRRVDGAAVTTLRSAPPGPARAPALDRLPQFFDRDHPTPGEWFIWPGWGVVGQPAWQPPVDQRTITALAADARFVAIADDRGATLLGHHPGAATYPVPHPTPVTAVALVDDILLTGGADGAVRRFAATDGRPLGETPDRRGHPDGFPAPIRWLIPSPDGAVVAASRLGDWHTELMPVRPGARARTPAPGLTPWSRLATDARGRRLLVGQHGGQLTGWDLDRVRRLDGFVSDSPATALMWSAASPVTGHADGSIIRWHPDGRLRARMAAHAPGRAFSVGGAQLPTGGVDGLFEWPDGTWISTGRDTIRRWRAGTALATYPLPHPSLQLTAPVADGQRRLVISTINGLVRVDPRDGRVEALDPPAGGIRGAPYFRVAAGGPYVAGVRQAPDGQRLSIWRSAGAPIVDQPLPPGRVAQALAFAPAGRRLAVISARASTVGRPEAAFPIILVDPATGAPTGEIEGHRAAITAARFDPDPPPGHDRLLTGSYDGHRRVFEIDGAGPRLVEQTPDCPATALQAGPGTVALCADRVLVDLDGGRLTLIDDPDGRWLIAGEAGHFTASTEGDRLAAAVAGPRIVGLDRIALLANRPDRIAHRFGLGDAPLRADLQRRVERRRQKHGSSGADPAAVTLPRVDLAPISITDGDALVRGGARSPRGLAGWRLRVDGTVAAGGPLDGAPTARFEARVPLTDGLNRIEVDVADRDGRWSPRAVGLVAHEDARPTRLHVFAFGVSRYADPAIRDLRFAHRDAQALVALFERAPGFAAVIGRAYIDEAVVEGAFDEVAALLAEADPRDTVVIFISGHGLYDRGGIYRYLTHETRLDRVEEGLAFDRIEALLDATPARQRLMLLDTCQSGELFDDEAVTAPAPTAGGQMRARVLPGGSRLIRPIAAAPPTTPADRRDRFVDRDLRRGRGAVVFSSSRGSEASWELDTLGHGAFTSALLDALGGAADTDGDGWIALDALQDHVAAAVPRLTGGRQHPTIDRENRAARIRLPVIPAAPR